jgi:beta-lactamase superfamily II metal-dependent hydrolase
VIDPIPGDRLGHPGYWPDPAPDELVYFLLNVGDGDSQVILLPANSEGRRSLILVDIADEEKTSQLVNDLVARDLLIQEGEPPVSLLIATHPHRDHIRGIGSFLRAHQGEVREVWSSGLHVPTAAYFNMLQEIRLQAIAYAEPASGSCRYLDTATITVLSPGVALKNLYYSYGVRANDSSICVRIDSPAAVVARRERVLQLTRSSRATLLLGADAQNLSSRGLTSELTSRP